MPAGMASIICFTAAIEPLEACRVILGPRSEIGFRVHGTQGALSWEFERMNEFELYLASDEQGQRGYRRVVAGPSTRRMETSALGRVSGSGTTISRS